MSGILFVIATPIGNLEDLSPRATATLREVALVLAEDTRRTGLLLKRAEIDKPLLSCHRFNEASRGDDVLLRLERGESLALVSDGGTPAVSDPGARLVAEALARGIRVVPIPGPSAVTAALSASGLDADRFVFAGFLPSRAGERRREIARLALYPETLVLYEAPHRLAASLRDLAAILGPRDAVLCRELTKLHEEVRRAPLTDLAIDIAERESIRGEIVLVVAGASREGGAAPAEAPNLDPAVVALREAWAAALATEEGDPRRALRRLARDLGIGRAELKRRLDAGLAGIESVE